MAKASNSTNIPTEGHHYEPSPRWGSITSASAEELYLYGGCVENFKKITTQLNKTIQVYDSVFEEWREISTTGTPPQGLYRGAASYSDHFFHIFGGFDKTSFSASLHQLDTTSYTWTHLSSQHENGPMKKDGCSMIYYNNSLVIFGGFCISTGEVQAGSQFIKSTVSKKGRGWTNEIHKFNISEGIWSSPLVSGTRPPPSAYFSFTMYNMTDAVFFGGSGPTGRSNHTFLLDLNTMHFTKLSLQDGDPHPIARSHHAAVCLGYGSDHPQLLVHGGLGKRKNVLNDLWCLDVDSRSWKEISVSGVQPRFSHSAAAFITTPELTEVVVFGGCPEWPINYKSHDDLITLADTTILRLEKDINDPQTEWILTDVSDKAQRGSKKRVREKMIKVSHCTHEISRSKQEAERRVLEAERGREEAVRRREEAERSREEAERSRQESERSRQECERSRQESERSRQEAETSKQEAETRKQDLEIKLAKDLECKESLSTENLPDVLEEIHDSIVKWRNIGLKLGLSIGALNIIESNRNNNAELCCQEMINEWLCNAGKDRTWSALANVMDSRVVNRSDIANAIRKKHICK